MSDDADHDPSDPTTPRLPRKAAGKSTRRVADPNAWRTADETAPEPAKGTVEPAED